MPMKRASWRRQVAPPSPSPAPSRCSGKAQSTLRLKRVSAWSVPNHRKVRSTPISPVTAGRTRRIQRLPRNHSAAQRTRSTQPAATGQPARSGAVGSMEGRTISVERTNGRSSREFASSVMPSSSRARWSGRKASPHRPRSASTGSPSTTSMPNRVSGTPPSLARRRSRYVLSRRSGQSTVSRGPKTSSSTVMTRVAQLS